MRSVVLFLFFYLIFVALVQAQLLHDYHPLSSSGKIPEEFLVSSTSKYEYQRKKIQGIAEKFERNARDRFYLESNFYIDALMLSGKVLFNDPIGKYINRVADEVLKAQPRLRKQLRFYVVKSPGVNAFSSERGSIFINLGLITRLENEAQLAFILSHEIIHYTQRHAIDSYVAAQYVDDERGAYRQASRYEKMLIKSHYSREQEIEADEGGFKLFSQTVYAKTEAITALNMLQKARQPYGKLKAGVPQFLNTYLSEKDYERMTDALLINPSYKMDTQVDTSMVSRKVSTIKTDHQDTLESHPNLAKRALLIQLKLDTLATSGKYFTLTKRQFLRAREMARFELCQLFLTQTAYKDALYQVHLLLPIYEDELYLKQSMAKALYGLAKYHLAGKAPKLFLDYHQLSREEGRLLKQIQTLAPPTLALIALTYCWELYLKAPENEYLPYLIKDLMRGLLKLPSESETIDAQSAWIKKTLKQLNQEEAFSSLYEICQQELIQLTEQIAFQQRAKRRPRRRHQKTYKLGIDTLVIFGPIYYRIDKRKKHDNPLQFVASEQQQARFYDLIRTSARKLALKLYLLDSRSLRERDPAAHFNDIARMYAWHEELLRHEDMQIICSNYDQVLPLIEQFGTPYFAHMGAFSMRTNFNFTKLLVAIPTLAAPAVWPIFVYLAVQPNEASFFYTWVYDLKAHTAVMRQYNRMKMKTNETVLQSNIYYNLWQIQRKDQRKR